MYGEQRRAVRFRAARVIAATVLFVTGACAPDDDSIKDPDAITIPSPPAPAPGSPTTTHEVAGSTAPGPSVTVEVRDNAFDPKEVQVRVGTAVSWSNNGRNDHDVLPVDDLTGSTWGVRVGDFSGGARYSHVFTTPGTFVYLCTIHGAVVGGSAKGMVGVVTVTP